MASCQDSVSEKQIAAQVGKNVLLYSEIFTEMPLGVSGADSVEYIKNYIKHWVDDKLMYEQGLRNLPNLDEIDRQVEDYRISLISQSYENELLRRQVSQEINDAECMEFYEKHSKQIKAEEPIIQGVFMKLLLNSSKVKEVRAWLEKIDHGNTDVIEEVDQYGNHRAADYDNFYDQWVPLNRLADKLPVTVVDAASFLKCKVYEIKDDDYYYLFLIKDYRLEGEEKPFDYAKPAIYELLLQQKKKAMHEQLHRELTEEGLKSGFVKINYEL